MFAYSFGKTLVATKPHLVHAEIRFTPLPGFQPGVLITRAELQIAATPRQDDN